MKRMLFTAALCLASTTLTQSVSADWHQFWDRVHLDYARNVCWPSPFIENDRAAINNHFSAIVHKGTRLQNTLGDFHFDLETNKINRAGEMKIRSIMRSTPDRRDVFVLQGLTQDVTEVRMSSTNEAVTRLIGDDNTIGVYETDEQNYGRPADYINEIYRADLQSTPAPRLPAASSDSGS